MPSEEALNVARCLPRWLNGLLDFRTVIVAEKGLEDLCLVLRQADPCGALHLGGELVIAKGEQQEPCRLSVFLD